MKKEKNLKLRIIVGIAAVCIAIAVMVVYIIKSRPAETVGDKQKDDYDGPTYIIPAPTD